MVDIVHRVGMKDSSVDEVYAALATIDGLAAWWTVDTKGESVAGGTIQFNFEADGVPIGGFDMRVVELVPGKHVFWEVIDGPPEWVGTTVDYELKQEDDFTIVLFTHAGWREPVEFMSHCSTKWATFLLSLKSYVETGTGSPAPGDTKVSNWH